MPHGNFLFECLLRSTILCVLHVQQYFTQRTIYSIVTYYPVKIIIKMKYSILHFASAHFLHFHARTVNRIALLCFALISKMPSISQTLQIFYDTKLLMCKLQSMLSFIFLHSPYPLRCAQFLEVLLDSV